MEIRVGGVFLDIKGAFDNVDTVSLITILLILNLPRTIVNFVQFMLTNRNITEYYQERDFGMRTTSTGVPQGSVPSPILFDIYIANIHGHLDKDFLILAYADDVAIFYSRRHISDVCRKLNINLERISRNLASLDLSLSPAKTQFCFFARNKRFVTLQNTITNAKCEIRIDNNIVPVTPTATFLGYVFDFQLNWKAHIDKIRTMCFSKLNIIKALAGLRWRSHPSTLLTIYKGFIRSVLIWGGLVLVDSSDKKFISLDRIQYVFIRVVLGLVRITPTNVILD